MRVTEIVTRALAITLPLVSGSCLPTAVPTAELKNLVNANGESYPVGFFISNYAASFAANILAATLVKEVLGFNTTLNLDALGSGTVAGYYGVSGCRTPSNVANRGCMHGVTYYHVHLESWLGIYPADWDYIQQTYTTMAAKDLGSMGYEAFSTMYVPKQAQSQAYSTVGGALQYYRDWNTSWNAPWNYFDQISSVNSSKLMRCNDSTSAMSNDPTMRRHIENTGDVDGVIVINDTYSARCDDGFWWLSPSCRSTPSKCIPFITGGVGWGLEEFMQKFSLFNMPLAIAVAGSWSDYTTLPLSGLMSFYWWAPDPTFLELSPLVVKFPPHQRSEFRRGRFTSEASRAVVSSLVSPDLAVLAPVVEGFIDKLDLPMSQMDEILLEQSRTLKSWEEVTCDWILMNQLSWQKWIPDESACAPGFGLYDSVLQTFTNVRVNAANKIVCEACPPGSFSQKLEDYGSGSYVCVSCGTGTSQDSGASLDCKPCKAGEYQDELNSKECKRCAIGTYQDESGQDGCKPCPGSTSTLGLGSIAAHYCGCQKGYIDMDKTGGFNCVKCGEGLDCPALSQLVDLEAGESAVAQQIPKIQPGYFSTKESPTEVFLCTGSGTCPGGTPGSCTGGLQDTPCSRCAEGATWRGQRCEDCAWWIRALWVMGILGLFAVLIAAYYFTTTKLTNKASVLFTTLASMSVLVMSMQSLGLIGMMTVDWPEGLQGLFRVCQFLLLDIDGYGFSCVSGQSSTMRYLLTALIFPVGITWLAISYGVSWLFRSDFHWDGPKVASTMGAFLQVGFSTMSATALTPMICYKHPNGLRSVLKYPGVICGSEDHQAMLVAALLLLVIFVFGFLAVCIFIVTQVPRWTRNGHRSLAHSSRFLIFRFKFDSWWYGVPLLLRGPLINLPIVLATDYPPVQVVSIAMLLTTMLVVQILSWPWKVPLLTAIDCVISFCFVLLVTDATLYIDNTDEGMAGFALAVSNGMLGSIGAAIGIMLLMVLLALFYRGVLGTNEDLKFFNLGTTPQVEDFADKVQEMSRELERIEFKQLCEKLNDLPVSDVHKITTCITLLATEVAPPAEDGRSFKFQRRISAVSFDPGMQRKSVSRRSIVVEDHQLVEDDVVEQSVEELHQWEHEEPTNSDWL